MIRRFFQSRSWRKFSRSKLALFSLAVIGIYGLIGTAVITLDLVTLEETLERVGPSTVPGFSFPQKPEKRLEDSLFWLDTVDRAVSRAERQENPELLREVRFAERTLAEISPAEMRIRVDEAFAIYDSLANSSNLNDEREALPMIKQLEEKTQTLFAPLAGLQSLRYALRYSLGLDRQGRSIFIRGLYSIRVAILIGLITALFSVIFGGVLGAAAAFYGGWVDHLVIWLYSTFSSIPNLVLLFVLVVMFTGSAVDGTLIPVYVAFCLTFWIGPCRVIRGEALKIKELEYVQAATCVGFGRFYILLRHVLPNTAHLLLINFSLLFIGAVKSEVILSFLGLGVKKGPSWGIMISHSAPEVINGFFWQIGAATAFMFGLVLAFNILSDALQDALDPKHV